MKRRDFLRLAGGTAAAAALGSPLHRLFGGTSAEAAELRGFAGSSVLDVAAKEAPIDHVVVMMMENRSFDHFLGWVADDGQFLEAGRRRHGKSFHVNGRQRQAYRDPNGRRVPTYYLPEKPGEENPYRGCAHPDPGHGWNSGRAQRDRGFLGRGSGNDEFALGYYHEADVPFYARLAKRFTIFDHYHCSVLAPTFPNREYLHSGQSGGFKSNVLPSSPEGFTWPTIWDKLGTAGVPAAYYFVDLPTIGLWGPRMVPRARHIEAYFEDCATGLLPNVTYVDPGFTTGLRTDDHPFADIRSGQKFVFDVFKAFAESSLWERGAFFLTYDEWGGFFDHVRPPLLPDDRANRRDADNFAQAGFRVPTIMASPFARRGFVDHRVYDHTSILRFIEWRFLGAPAEGPRGRNWYLTKRDRHALNIGSSLVPSRQGTDMTLDFLPEVPVSSPPCRGETTGPVFGDVPVPKSDFELAMEAGFFERMGFDIDLRPLPV